MNKRAVGIGIGVLLTTMMLSAQVNYIGMHKDAIIKTMQVRQKNMNLDNTTINRTFNYLKYVDFLNEQTLLYFLDDEDYCIWWRLMCDYILLEEKKQWLDNSFTKNTNNRWEYTYGKDTVVFVLDEREWFFSITARLNEQIKQ